METPRPSLPPVRRLTLADVVATSAAVRGTASRLEKLDRLAALLRRLAPDEVDAVVAWLSGELAQGRIGLGPAVVREALAVAPAEESAPPLLAVDVDGTFAEIAAQKGAGSGRGRGERLNALFARARRDEQEFLARLLVGELRQGALEGIMIEAVARAAGIDASAVRRAAMLCGSLREAASAALKGGAVALDALRFRLFRPVMPMLAQPADDVDDALARIGTASLEWKLDGARIQAHKGGDEVRLYSRGLKDVSAAAPEIVAAVRALPARELVLDGEVLALDDAGRPRPFQVTMSRFGRKLDVEAMRARLPLSAYFFDCLAQDGAELFDAPAAERAAAVESNLAGAEVVRPVPRLVTGDVEAADAFFADAIARGHEGLLAKDPASPYLAGARGASWLKVKPAHTLDLVVIAIERGSGRREGWLSNLHLGARDPATGGFVMLGKTFKGMTDAMLEWQTRRFRELAISDDGYVVHVRPEQVVEIAFNDVQRSAQYPGGMALRFARVKRYRMDKRAGEADTIDAVRALLG